jgi:hypothetical protein
LSESAKSERLRESMNSTVKNDESEGVHDFEMLTKDTRESVFVEAKGELGMPSTVDDTSGSSCSTCRGSSTGSGRDRLKSVWSRQKRRLFARQIRREETRQEEEEEEDGG